MIFEGGGVVRLVEQTIEERMIAGYNKEEDKP